MHEDTIAAIATSPGSGAIAIVRISGKDALSIVDDLFYAKGKKLIEQKPGTIHFGEIRDGENLIDEVLVSVFKAPKSYTGEDSIEISCHGSMYIQQKILQLLIEKGARIASPGEFTQRAFLNGKMDLSQAEAVADLIASKSKASHQLALQQMRGGFSSDLQELRKQLLHFASLTELELDFSEEDVEFADRTKFMDLANKISRTLRQLIESFSFGNALKNGIPAVIIGEPNVGKSTLLNALLNEEKAIVSEIPGTTRDAIEDELIINGIAFRFIDTAGIRETNDVVESIGIQKAFEKINRSQVVIYLIDAKDIAAEDWNKFQNDLDHIHRLKRQYEKPFLTVINKSDLLSSSLQKNLLKMHKDLLFVSAKEKLNIELLKTALLEAVQYKQASGSETIISNARHYELLRKASEATDRIKDGLHSGISGDFIAQDTRTVLNYMGEITGEFTTDEVLGNIFAHFCIGK